MWRMKKFHILITSLLWYQVSAVQNRVRRRDVNELLSKVESRLGNVKAASTKSKLDIKKKTSEGASITSLIERVENSRRRLSNYSDTHHGACEQVVDHLQFYIEAPIETIYIKGSMYSSNSTKRAGDYQQIGTKWIFNGPLLTFDADEGLIDISGFFVSGICQRTYFNLAEQGIPGANFCSMAVSMDTGAALIAEGEVFDGWNSNVAIVGGTQEMIGAAGQLTLTPLDEMFGPLDIEADVFEDSSWLRGRAVVIYPVCESGFYNEAFELFEELDAHDPIYEAGEYPNPFELQM